MEAIQSPEWFWPRRPALWDYLLRRPCGLRHVFSLRPPATACRTALCPWLETILLQLRRRRRWRKPSLWRPELRPGRQCLRNHDRRRKRRSELSPTQSGFTETTLYSFTNNDNGSGAGGLIMDAHGDLFGMTGGFLGTAGAAYELTPRNGAWSFTLLQTFPGDGYPQTLAAPTLDLQGNLYGPIPSGGGSGYGEIFQLTPAGNQWIYTSFYEFSNVGPAFPIGAVTFDANGNMYGTTDFGGAGEGTVWEITP
jgi:hypothetical protein